MQGDAMFFEDACLAGPRHLKVTHLPDFLTPGHFDKTTNGHSGPLSFSYLEEFVIPNTIGELPNGILSYTLLHDIQLPSQIRKLGVKAFAFSPRISQISIPCSVDTIEFATFQNCSSLKSFAIEDDDKPIHMGVFEPVELYYNNHDQYDEDGLQVHTAKTHKIPFSRLYSQVDGNGDTVILRNKRNDYLKNIVDADVWRDMTQYTLLDTLYVGRNIDSMPFNVNDKYCINLFCDNYEVGVGEPHFYGMFQNNEYEYFVFHDYEALFKSQFALKYLGIGPLVTDVSFLDGMPVLEQLVRVDLHSPTPRYDISKVVADKSTVELHVPIGCKEAYLNDFAYADYATIIADLPNHDAEASNGYAHLIVTDSEVPNHSHYGNEALNAVTVSSSVASVGFGAFGGCENLKKFTIEAGPSPITMKCLEPVMMGQYYYYDWEVFGHSQSTHDTPMSELYKGDTYTILDTLSIGRNIEYVEAVSADANSFGLEDLLFDQLPSNPDPEDPDVTPREVIAYCFHDYEGLFKSQFNLKVLEVGRMVTNCDFINLMPVQEHLVRLDIHQPKPRFDITPIIANKSAVELHVPRSCYAEWKRNFRYSDFTIIDDLPNPDVNHDNKVDVGDVNTLLEAILGGNDNLFFDQNGDGKIDVGDVNVVLGLILSGV